MVIAAASATAEASPTARRRLRIAALGAFVLVLVVWTWQIGFPTGRLEIFGWAWAATIAWRFDQPVRAHLAFVRDWWVPAAVMLFYVYSRSIADHFGSPVQWTWPIDVDRWLGFGQVPAQRLQEALCGRDCTVPGTATALDTVATTVYASHFVVAWVIAVVLWLRDRGAWVRWLQRLLSLNLAGIAAAIVVPMAPPWLASDHGLLTPSVVRLTGRGWSDLGIGFSAVIKGPLANDVAAMPSIHTATAALVSLYAVLELRSRWRWLALAYLPAMCFTLVYFGEHYVIDEIAGIVLAILVLAFWSRWDRRRA